MIFSSGPWSQRIGFVQISPANHWLYQHLKVQNWKDHVRKMEAT